MKIQKTVQVFAILVVLAMCLSGTALAQSTNKAETVAAVAADRGEVRWQPQVEYGRLILTVSAPSGEVFRKEFEAGTTPSFKLTDSEGYNLPDGSYSYELRVIPNLSREVRKALAASRENGNTADVMRELQKSGQLPTSLTVQSGSFLIEKGAVLAGSPEDGVEPRAPKQNNELQSKKKGGGGVTITDVVTADDIIVQGSACIGLDCVNNESFGFDTIRLKENNTRIKFDDTSTAAGFPATDWQLTANDSASGGANKFSIEDITAAKVPFTITGNAPTNSLFVASNGKVGLRTGTPVLDLHITTSDTPAHRLEQTAAGGFTAQTWDVAGNEANFFVRDVTGGSRLPFRIRPGAPTSSVDISASGNVGVGTASPQVRLHVGSGSATPVTGGASLLVEEGTSSALVVKSTSGGEFFLFQDNTNAVLGTASNHPLDLRTNNATRIFVTAAGNVGFGGLTGPTNPIQHQNGAFLSAGGAWTNASSRAFKTDIRTLALGEAIDALRGLNPVKFQYKQEPGKDYVGFIAEDVPELVATDDRKGLSSMDIVGVLTKVVQEQQKTIAELKERVDRLASRRATTVRHTGARKSVLGR